MHWPNSTFYQSFPIVVLSGMLLPAAAALVILSSLLFLFLQLPATEEIKCGNQTFQVNSDSVFPIKVKYGKNEEQHCRWHFASHPSYISRLECLAINLPSSPGCSMDQLKISSTDSKVKEHVYCDRGRVRLVVLGPGIDVMLDTSPQTPGGNFSCKVTAMLNNCSCGYKYPQPLPTSRIYDGVDTGTNNFPMMVRVLKGGARCGGTIISQRYVLTAAHCMLASNRTAVVYAGEHDIDSADGKTVLQRFTAAKIIIHENYNKPAGIDNDIALLRLDRDIQFSERVGPACLPFKYTEHDFTGTVLTLTGWGMTEDGYLSYKLRKVDVKVTSLESCRKAYPIIKPKNICTYARNKDACKGDSGGPGLYTEPGTGRQFVCAVISTGFGCGRPNFPGVNVNVVLMLRWIVANTPDVQYCAK